MGCSFLTQLELKKFIDIYKKKINIEPEGNKMFSIYDCKFFVNIYYDDKIIPFQTEINYFYKCNVSGKNNLDYITLKAKPLDSEEIKLRYNKILGFSISCQYCSNCKEYLIKKKEKHFKIPYITESKKKEVENYSKNCEFKFCFRGNTDFKYLLKYSNNNLYLDSFECKMNKNDIKSKFVPDFGENFNNPLFNIQEWDCELTLNGKKIELSDFEDNDIPKEKDYFKRNLYLYISPKGSYNSISECEIKYNDILSLNIFVTYNKKKFRIKNISDIPIGKILIDSIKKKDNVINDDLFDDVETKYKNNLYFGSYMLNPSSIKKIDELREKREYDNINKIEKSSTNYYYNLQYIRCSISTHNLLEILTL